MTAKKVLFVCIHNSGRSQMAEALLSHIGGTHFAVESAGLEPGTLNPLAVEAMKEIGIDISRNKTKSVFDLLKQGRTYHYVIAVCDEASAERCPVFPGAAKKIHWSFEDPAHAQGTPEEKRAKVRAIREQIREKVEAFVSQRTESEI